MPNCPHLSDPAACLKQRERMPLAKPWDITECERCKVGTGRAREQARVRKAYEGGWCAWEDCLAVIDKRKFIYCAAHRYWGNRRDREAAIK